MRDKVRTFAWVATVIGAVALAWAWQSRSLTINGVTYPDSLVLSGGRTFVALDALRKAGAQVSVTPDRVSVQFQPLAGREQTDAVEGRLEEWIQNAAWRIRVTKVEKTASPFGRGPGFAVEFELRNLAARAVSPFQTGMDRLQVVDDKGTVFHLASTSFNQIYSSVPPAASITARAMFGDPQNSVQEAGEADKLLVLFRSTGGKPAHKHFRVFLRERPAGG
jgi:hypothetical protein